MQNQPIVKQHLEAAFEHLNANTTGRIKNLYTHVRTESMEASDNEEDDDREDDSDVEGEVEDQEDCDPFQSQRSCSSDDTSHESDTDDV